MRKISLEDIQKLLKREVNQTTPYIYRVPIALKKLSPSSFTPQMVSIGPLYWGAENLNKGEDEKCAYVSRLLRRLPTFTTMETAFTSCEESVTRLHPNIKSCYDDLISYDDRDLAIMMVIDGCFILEFLYVLYLSDQPGQQLENIIFVQLTIYDLLLLENQIPFSVLIALYNCTISTLTNPPSLGELIHKVIEKGNPFIQHNLKRIFPPDAFNLDEIHHILDFLHKCYQYGGAQSVPFSDLRFPSVLQLDMAGVKFKPSRDTKWPLAMDVKSRRFRCFLCFCDSRTLIMPLLHINDFTVVVLRNLIAYEQLSRTILHYVTSYATAMDMLIDTPEDIAKLIESEVFINNIGSNQEAADLINNICKQVACRDFFYNDQWMILNRHCSSRWARSVTTLKRTQCNNIWTIIGLLGAIILFALTATQTYYAVPKNK